MSRIVLLYLTFYFVCSVIWTVTAKDSGMDEGVALGLDNLSQPTTGASSHLLAAEERLLRRLLLKLSTSDETAVSGQGAVSTRFDSWCVGHCTSFHVSRYVGGDVLQLPPEEFVQGDTPFHHGAAHLLETAWLCLCDGTAISTLEGMAAVTEAVVSIRQARVSTLSAAKESFAAQVLDLARSLLWLASHPSRSLVITWCRFTRLCLLARFRQRWPRRHCETSCTHATSRVSSE